VDPEQLEELGIRITGEESGIEWAYATEGKPGDDSKRREPRVTREQVLHVAKLARLKIPEKELDAYANDLNSVLDYVEKLSELDTTDVEPTSHVLPMKNVWRLDEAMDSEQAEDVLKEAPERMDNFFKVPRILES